MDYVFKKNNLDEQMEAMQVRVAKLEKVAHEPKEYIVCKKCNQKSKRNK